MQRRQHEAAAYEQPGSEGPCSADLNEVYEWFIVGCNDDHECFPATVLTRESSALPAPARWDH